MILSPSVRKKKPTRDKERSRRKFIDATIEVLRQQGPSGLTTGRIAKAAGLSQPSFYVHFTDMDDALRVVSEEVVTGIRSAIQDARQKAAPGADADAVRNGYAVAVNEFLAQPDLTELFLRHKNDSTAFGERLRELVQAFHQDLLADLEKMGMRGVVGDLELYAHFVVGMTLMVVEGVLLGRLEDKEQAIDALAAASVSMSGAFSGTNTTPSSSARLRRREQSR